MGSVYRRGDSRFWWVAYKDLAGKRQAVSSEKTERADAELLLAELERRVRAERVAGVGPKKAATLRWYVEERWLPDRRERKVRSVDSDEDRLGHVLPILGDVLLKDITRKMLRDLVRSVSKKSLAPRTVRHVYAAMRVVLADAVADELIAFSPATLKQRRGELPKKRDKDPAWRAGAVFLRPEVVQLISDTRIPEYRRVLWGLLFLAGLRINEATPRRWRQYDPGSEPLGTLLIDSHWDVKAKVEIAGTKTGPYRLAPVHRTLAKLLAHWKLEGWAKFYGRAPGPGDLIVQAPRGGVLHSSRTLTAFHRDCELLGLRRRRQHDARRTFITLARADGAEKDLLRWVTHGPPEDVMDAYTTPPWATLCGQVDLLKLKLPAGKVLKMAATAKLRRTGTGGNMASCNVGEEGLEPSPGDVEEAPQDAQGVESAGSGTDSLTLVAPEDSTDRSNVATEYERRAEALGFKVTPSRGGR